MTDFDRQLLAEQHAGLQPFAVLVEAVAAAVAELQLDEDEIRQVADALAKKEGLA
jgi:hypothetical protein